ncbi:helix-turn-helix domain-containing protein [Kurthia massiliensis]|uniref:helix-turn-helix domain-containing protein n=1 Tax=Kurthia massiliensis TaxID=1033739 RepID=UPI000288FBAB|nr:helix-turn-helix transcriptional regulator [Kurthia massiliensis]
MFNAKLFGEQLKSLRETSNHSMLSLAKQIGTSASRIKSWEVGESVPSAKWIVKLSQALAISADELLLNQVDDGEIPSLSDVTKSRNSLLRDLNDMMQSLTKQDLMELYVLAEVKQKSISTTTEEAEILRA